MSFTKKAFLNDSLTSSSVIGSSYGPDSFHVFRFLVNDTDFFLVIFLSWEKNLSYSYEDVGVLRIALASVILACLKNDVS